MTERPLLSPLPTEIIDAQRRAADPQSSIWVAANAGSGKTRVLTDRVLRLMLADVRPDQILCLTYTKAAAAEMRQRVSDRLAQWALADDDKLRGALRDLSGVAPPDGLLGKARRLFATALETPGGLKIQTIHAFCEAVLHRFPVEADVPFDFRVVEDHDAARMVLEAREAIMAAGLRGEGPVSDSATALFDALSEHALGTAVEAALATGARLRHLLEDPSGAKHRLRRLVAIGADTEQAVLDEIVGGYGLVVDDHDAVLSLCPPNVEGSRFEDKLARLVATALDADRLLATYLTADQTVPKTFPKKIIRDQRPDLCARLEREAARLEALAERLRRVRLVERSEALVDLLDAIHRRYSAAKRARSLLDFDDLVDRMAELLANRPEGQWVRYKLDGGLHHILVDESQDTNPEQWKVVDALAEEFFEPGGIEGLRTLFVVGDGKQSIYSFQGADPEQFVSHGADYAQRAQRAEARFETVRLLTSFRTLPGVLAAVDRVFADPERQAAVLEAAEIRHRTARSDTGGTVTLWPPLQEVKPDDAPEEGWVIRRPPDTRSAVRQVAERIAGQIRQWLDTRRPLGARGRAVAPEDILILVQSRSALFHELIRALRRGHIPTPGADRLAVTTHIAVRDLMALGDVLLNPAEDLQLAAVLRSPLFDISDDDLMLFAPGRAKGETLWQALGVSDLEGARQAAEQLQHWRARLDLERPFDFFARILNAEGGMRRFHGRMGLEVDDVFAEFLDLALQHEQSPQPSLQGFLAEMRSRDVTIRRELSERAAGVRVMTVHGAKGLEAPIVILADAASKPNTTRLNSSVYVDEVEGLGPVLAHLASGDAAIAPIGAIRATATDRQMREYWRRLYVAMTRAEDELYVTGVLTASGKPDGTWYQAIETALAPQAASVDTPELPGALRFPAEAPMPKPARPVLEAAAAPATPVRLAVLPRPVLRPYLSPSQLVPHAPVDGDPLATAADAIRDAESARRAGLAVHALLQHLPRIGLPERPAVAMKALAALWPDGAAEHAVLAQRALSILGRPEFAELFGPKSRAEVPFLAQGARNGQPVTFAGRIDRMLVAPDRVLVVDFKSDANPAMTPESVPRPYKAQLAVYALVAAQLFPTARVEAAILWTSLESLLELPPVALAEVAAQFTVG